MTLIQHADLGGSIPEFLMNKLIKSSLGNVQTVLKKFKRRGEITDQEIRDAFIDRIQISPPLLPEQQQLVDRCMLLEDFGRGEFKELKSSDHRVKYYQRYNPSVPGESNVATGKATTQIDASAESVLAWRWAWCSNEKMQIHREDSRSVSRSVEKEVSNNHLIVSTTKKFPFPFKSREFVISSVWSKLKDGSFVYCWETIDHASSTSNAIRGDSRGFMKMTNLPGNHRCEFTTVQKIDPKGWVPS